MNSILNKNIVLVLNRNWQAINIRTPQEAFCMMATNVATALEIEFDEPARLEKTGCSALPLPKGPHSATRFEDLGHPSRGGVGNSLGRGEGEEVVEVPSVSFSDGIHDVLNTRSIRPVPWEEWIV